MDYDSLTSADVSALCVEFGLPLPTPDVPFARCAEQRGLTPESLYNSLQNTRSLSLMIAAAALRGTTRLPPDPQLRPAAPPYRRPLPHEGPPPVKRERTPKQVALATEAWKRNDAVVQSVAPNPKRPGTAAYDRYAFWRVGATLAECRAAGLGSDDLRWDISRGYVVVEAPSDVA